MLLIEVAMVVNHDKTIIKPIFHGTNSVLNCFNIPMSFIGMIKQTFCQSKCHKYIVGGGTAFCKQSYDHIALFYTCYNRA